MGINNNNQFATGGKINNKNVSKSPITEKEKDNLLLFMDKLDIYDNKRKKEKPIGFLKGIKSALNPKNIGNNSFIIKLEANKSRIEQTNGWLF